LCEQAEQGQFLVIRWLPWLGSRAHRGPSLSFVSHRLSGRLVTIGHSARRLKRFTTP
jgi:hypothetical protein